MKRTKLNFTTAAQLTCLVDSYFKEFEGKKQVAHRQAKTATADKAAKKPNAELIPATFTGLALHLGFESINEFQEYERKGKHAPIVKRARLRIEAIYENKLHYYAPTGAIFALKSMGWGERAETTGTGADSTSITVIVVESGPKPASSEKEVIL